ncbi:MAG: uroporphyrinogen decarboxylase family protein [Armatimonadota bacterium]
MTNRERVLASLQHRQPDRTPFQISFTQKAHARIVEYTGDPDFARGIDNCLLWMSTADPEGWREVAPDIWEDEFGVQWNRTIDKDIGNVCNCRVTPETLDEYVFPDPRDARRSAKYAETIAAQPGQFALADIGFSLFERAWTLCGFENLLMAMVEEPEFAHGLLDRILEHNLARIDAACRYPIDGMIFGDDWGQQRGLIMGPELWREFIKPRVQAMYGRVKSHGKYVFIHSCGKVDEVFPDLIECGLDVFNPFQPEVIDVFAVKQQFGGRLSFFGGISTQRLLPYGTPDQVREEVRILLKEIGRDGGYIAAPAHSIPGDAKPENILAMLEVLRDQ